MVMTTPYPGYIHAKTSFTYISEKWKKRDVASILPPDRSRLNMVYVPRTRWENCSMALLYCNYQMLQTFAKKELSGTTVKNSTAGMTGGIYRSIYNLDLSGEKSMTGPTINAIHRRIKRSLASLTKVRLCGSVTLPLFEQNWSTVFHQTHPWKCNYISRNCSRRLQYLPTDYRLHPYCLPIRGAYVGARN